MHADPRSSCCLVALACALGACDATVVGPRDGRDLDGSMDGAALGDGGAMADAGPGDAGPPPPDPEPRELAGPCWVRE